MRGAPRLLITDEARAELEAMASSPSLAYRAVRQAYLYSGFGGALKPAAGRRVPPLVRSGRCVWTRSGVPY